MSEYRKWTITGVLLTVIIGSGIGAAVFYYHPSQPGNSTAGSPGLSSNLSTSAVAWSLSDCGVQTVTSTTTHTFYYADTTFTTTVYELTPNVIENNSTTYTKGESTLATYTSYGGTTTSTSTYADTTTYTTESLDCVVVHLTIDVSYSRTWNGTYSYGCCAVNGLIPVIFSGTGSKNVSLTFQGNLNDGICYSVNVQKDDSSNSLLNISAYGSPYLESYGNATSAPFGKVGWGACAIS